MEFKTKDIIDYLAHAEFEVEGTEFCEYKMSFDITPKDFLDFAELDLTSDLQHKFVNALSNAKRALDCQVICLLDTLGLFEQAEKKRWGLPLKIKALKKTGIIAPRILNKINKTRNLLEHEFTNPNSEQVTDFIDVVALFIEGTKRYLVNYLFFIETAWIVDKTMTLEISKNMITAEFYYVENEKDESCLSRKVVVKPDNDEYYRIMEIYHRKTEKIY